MHKHNFSINEYLVSASMRCRLKYVMMCSLLSITCVNTTPIMPSSVAMYSQNGILVVGALITGGEDKYFFISSKAHTSLPAEGVFESPDVMAIHSDWRTPFMIYLRTRGLPDDRDGHERLRRWAGHYTLVNDELFWKSSNNTLMWCIP
jgi:hypothetical protein